MSEKENKVAKTTRKKVSKKTDTKVKNLKPETEKIELTLEENIVARMKYFEEQIVNKRSYVQDLEFQKNREEDAIKELMGHLKESKNTLQLIQQANAKEEQKK